VADRLNDIVSRLVKESPGRDVLRRSALVHVAKPYDALARSSFRQQDVSNRQIWT
jgi:hypothetical protein